MLSGSVAFSSECSVHEPAHRAGRRMDAVAEAEEPVTPTAFGLDLIIVADAQGDFALDAAVAPPFAMEPFGTIALRHPVAFAAPDEHAGSIVGEERDDEIGRAHVRTPVTNAHLVCRLPLKKNK